MKEDAACSGETGPGHMEGILQQSRDVCGIYIYVSETRRIEIEDEIQE